MLGLRKVQGGYVFLAAARTEQLYLNLYRGKRRVSRLPFPQEERIGDVWRLFLPERYRTLLYCLEADGREFSDPEGRDFLGGTRFGELRGAGEVLKSPFRENAELFEAKALPLRPGIPYRDCIVYRLHVRGFTKHSSSGLPAAKRGSFSGIIEKLPYLKELGVNVLELMPPYEFQELMFERFEPLSPKARERCPDGRINYWGFTEDALYYSPKHSFTQSGQDPSESFRALVRAVHEQGMELVLDFYFNYDGGRELPERISEVLRFWRVRYQIDGAHIIGTAPLELLRRDPFLSRFKLWAEHWEGTLPRSSDGEKYLADYNDGFQTEIRRALKGDESMVGSLMERIRKNPSDRGEIQYLSNVTGLSLMDCFSYDRKHNEENGERGADGCEQNYSWNCGEEGPSRRKSVRLLRKKMFRNACLLLFLAQGTPLIQAGDEFGASRRGNNNAWCQDNELNWLDWRLLKKNRDLYEFMKYLIHFRREHPVFHQKEELTLLDSRGLGIPDLSFHGESAWQPDREPYRRQLGVMFSGLYAEDETFLLLCNFHWEEHRFLLPHPPAGTNWAMVIDSCREEQNGIYPKGEHPLLPDGEKKLLPRSIVLLQAEGCGEIPKKRRRRSGQRRRKSSEAGQRAVQEKQEVLP